MFTSHESSKERQVRLTYILARLWEAADVFAGLFIGFNDHVEWGERTMHVESFNVFWSKVCLAGCSGTSPSMKSNRILCNR